MRISDWSSDVCSSDLNRSVVALTPCVTSSAQTAVLRVVTLAPPTEKNAPSLRVVTLFATKESFYSTNSYPGLVASTLALRSEEHTSELQSLMRISYAVFCLKKKNINISQHMYYVKDYMT